MVRKKRKNPLTAGCEQEANIFSWCCKTVTHLALNIWVVLSCLNKEAMLSLLLRELDNALSIFCIMSYSFLCMFVIMT